MDLKLKGKTIAVTAASKGLGLAIAEKLAAEGASLSICSRQEDTIRETAERLAAQYGVRVIAIKADVGNREEVERFVRMTTEAFGSVDGLVCNAGGPPAGSFLSMEEDQWEQAFQTNLMSVVRLVRGFAPGMAESGGGRIVTVASSSVKVPIPGLVLSNTLRAGIAGLMKTLSIELADKGILVNTLCPGRIATDRLTELDGVKASRNGMSLEEVQAAALKEIPLGRYGKPEEFADMAAFLLSPVNSYMTGSTFFVDGGMVKSL